MSIYPKKSLQKDGDELLVLRPQKKIKTAVVKHELDDTEANTALDALGKKVNEILKTLEAFGVTV